SSAVSMLARLVLGRSMTGTGGIVMAGSAPRMAAARLGTPKQAPRAEPAQVFWAAGTIRPAAPGSGPRPTGPGEGSTLQRQAPMAESASLWTPPAYRAT